MRSWMLLLRVLQPVCTCSVCLQRGMWVLISTGALRKEGCDAPPQGLQRDLGGSSKLGSGSPGGGPDPEQALSGGLLSWSHHLPAGILRSRGSRSVHGPLTPLVQADGCTEQQLLYKTVYYPLCRSV